MEPLVINLSGMSKLLMISARLVMHASNSWRVPQLLSNRVVKSFPSRYIIGARHAARRMAA